MNPLLSEISEVRRRIGALALAQRLSQSTGADGRQGNRLALLLSGSALLTCVFAYLCDAGAIRVELARDGSALRQTIAFGYFYELNAALYYIVAVPLFVRFAFDFFSSYSFAIAELVSRGRLTAHTLSDEETDAATVISGLNRRYFRPWLLLLACAAAGLVIIASEFRPYGQGAYHKSAFGYVQAPFVSSYQGKTLSELATQRQLNRLEKVSDPEKAHWRIASVIGGPRSATQRLLYWPFVVGALAVQIAFVPIALWVGLKIVFALAVLLFAIAPAAGRSLGLRLDFADETHRCGLGELHRSFVEMLTLCGLGVAASLAAIISNVAKGSHEHIGSAVAGPSPVVIGQSFVSFFPMMILGSFVLFLILLRQQAQVQRRTEVERLRAEIRTAASQQRRTEIDSLIRLANEQTTWPNLKVNSSLAGNVLGWVGPIFFFSQLPEWALKLQRGWEGLVDAVVRFLDALTLNLL